MTTPATITLSALAALTMLSGAPLALAQDAPGAMQGPPPRAGIMMQIEGGAQDEMRVPGMRAGGGMIVHVQMQGEASSTMLHPPMPRQLIIMASSSAAMTRPPMGSTTPMHIWGERRDNASSTPPRPLMLLASSTASRSNIGALLMQLLSRGDASTTMSASSTMQEGNQDVGEAPVSASQNHGLAALRAALMSFFRF